MINWKALPKALLALLCCCYSFNSLAGQYDDHVFQVDDLNTIKDWWLSQGGSIDSYFYSETNTTGSDGSLGNEYICLRDDVNQVYVGRSDVCVNRQMDSTYSYVQIDKMDWTEGFPDLTVLQTGDLIGDTYEYWQGCFNVTSGPQWAGYSGGQCPNISTSYGGQINYGYIERTLKNIAAINLALEEAGVEVTGYTYSWQVKNADANYESSNNPNSVDPFSVTVKIRDENGNEVFSKTYDYSYWIDNWTTFSGTETLSNPLEGANLSELELSIKGYDIGYWAGYYGPEFREPSIKLNYRAASIPVEADTTVEDLLFDQMCTQDPLYDPSCPGYQDAMLAAINVDAGSYNDPVDITTNLNQTTDTSTEDPLTEIASISVPDSSVNTGVEDPADTTETITGSPEPAQGTEEPIQEQVAALEPVADPVEEVTEEPEQEQVAESSNESSGNSSSGGATLNAAQLAALDAANSVANNAVSTATESATASASVGLSSTGGVSSTLTSDGVTNEQGISSSMSEIIGGAQSTVGTVATASTQTTASSSSNVQSFGQPTITQSSQAISVAGADLTIAGPDTDSPQNQGSTDDANSAQTSQFQQSTSIAMVESDNTVQSYTPEQQSTDTNTIEETQTSYEVPSTAPLFEVQQFETVEIADTSGSIDTGADQFAVDEEYVEQNDQTQMQAMMEITGLYTTQNSTTIDNFDMSDIISQQQDNFGTDEMNIIPEPETVDLGAQELASVQQDFTAIEQNTGNTTGDDTQQSTGEEFAVTEAVTTEDITGEEALAQATALSEQASLENMLPTVDAVPVLSELDFVGRFVADFVASLPPLPPVQEAENKTAEEERLEAFTEAVLLAKAGNGDDSEDAKAAQLGHNPNFSAYMTGQLQDGKMYKDKEIYTNKKNYDSPNAGLFNAAGDARHRALVELQYNKEN